MHSSTEPSNPWSFTKEPDALDEVLQLISELDVDEDNMLLPEKEITEVCSETPLGRHLEIMQKIYDTKMTLQNTQLLQLRMKLDQDAPDVTHTEEIKIKTEEISQMITALDAAISENQLYDRLAEPLQDKTLKFQEKYHEDTVNGFSEITKCIGELQENLDTISWHKTHSMKDENISKIIEIIHTKTKNLKLLMKIVRP